MSPPRPTTGSPSPVPPEARTQHQQSAAEPPYYLEVGDEVEIFKAAFDARLPVLLKGPTGCGKTRFVEAMAWQLFGPPNGTREPLITVACHEDLTATDLVGRYLLQGEETVWIDGPLTRSVRQGGLCYLDEIVEARKDTTVLIHALTDHRRILPVEKRSEILDAHLEFLLVLSYNPGYQSVLKDLKPSTRQRFVSLEFGYPEVELEAKIVQHEAGVDAAVAERLAVLGDKVRNLHHHGFEEGVSTRLLVYAGQLIARGVPVQRACDVAICRAITDSGDVQEAVAELVTAIFG